MGSTEPRRQCIRRRLHLGQPTKSKTAPWFTRRWLSAAEGAELVGESPILCAVGRIARVAAGLEFEQLGVEPSKSHELIVATVLEHSSLVQHIDPIRPAD